MIVKIKLNHPQRKLKSCWQMRLGQSPNLAALADSLGKKLIILKSYPDSIKLDQFHIDWCQDSQ